MRDLVGTFVRKHARRLVCLVALAVLVGCRRGEEREPLDRHIARGVQLMMTEPRKALVELGRAKDQKHPLVLYGKALAHEELSEYAAAREGYEATLAVVPDANARLGLSRVLLMLGDLSKAREALEPLLAKTPVSPAVAVVETCLVQDQPQVRRALSHVEAALRGTGAAKPSVGEASVLTLAQASLLLIGGDSGRARDAKEKAEATALTDFGTALGAAKLAVFAHQRTFARLLLEKLAGKTTALGESQQVALLAHQLHDSDLTGRALEGIPEGDPAVLGLRALHYATTGHPSAERTIQKALAQAKSPGESVELRLLSSDVLMRQGKLEQALTELEEVDRLAPGNVGAIVQRARVSLRSGKPDEALATLERIAEKDRSLTVHEVWATAALQARSSPLARRELDRVLALRPDHQGALEALLALELKEAGPKAALARLEKQVAVAPQSASLRLLLSSTLRQQGKKAEAEAVLQQGMLDFPREAKFSVALARMQVARKANAEAEKTLLAALERDRAAIRIVAELAAFYARTNQPQRAAPYYGQVADFAGASPVALNNAAMLYADEVGDAAKAVEYAERAHKLAKNQAAVTDTLGWALYLRGAPGDLERAVELLESVKSDLVVPTARYHLGMARLKVGKKDEARQALQEALSAGGDFPEAAAAREALLQLG